jgi:hypothetical protein
MYGEEDEKTEMMVGSTGVQAEAAAPCHTTRGYTDTWESGHIDEAKVAVI